MFPPVALPYPHTARHAWMSYMVDKSPAQDPILQSQVRAWEPKEHRPTLTWSRSGYKPYSTYV
jgi:NADH:ubiquinone oxidoreductase subunit